MIASENHGLFYVWLTEDGRIGFIQAGCPLNTTAIIVRIRDGVVIKGLEHVRWMDGYKVIQTESHTYAVAKDETVKRLIDATKTLDRICHADGREATEEEVSIWYGDNQ